MDVRMPDGTLIKNVPEGTTQSELMRRYGAASESAPEPVVQEGGTIQDSDKPGLFREGSWPTRIAGAVNSFSRPLAMTARAGLGAFGGGYLADKLGLPKPANAWERVGVGGAEAMVGAGGLAAALPKLAAGASNQAAKAVMEQLGGQARLTVPSAAGAGMGGQIAAENDYGPLGQFAGSMAGGFGVPLAQKAGASFGGLFGDIATAGRGAVGHAPSVEKLAAMAIQNAAKGQEAQQRTILGNRSREVYEPTVAQSLAEGNIGQPTQIGGKAIRLEKELSGAGQGGVADILPSGRRAQDIAAEAYKENLKSLTAPMREAVMRDAASTNRSFSKLEKSLNYRQRLLENSVKKAEAINENYKPKPNWQTRWSTPDADGWMFTNKDAAGNPLPQMDKREVSISSALNKYPIVETLQKQLAVLESTGKEPIKIEQTLAKIVSLSNKPGNRASDIVQKTMAHTFDKIRNVADKNGYIHPEDYYTIRKEVGNTISTFAKETSNWDKRLSAGLARDIQRSMDESIEASIGNTGAWSGPKGYLKTYSDGMRHIDAAEEATKEARRIAAGIKGGTPDEISRGEVPSLPPLLNRAAMVSNWAIKKFAQRAQDPLIKKLAEAMQDPQEYMRLMSLPIKDPLRIKADQIVRNASAIEAFYGNRKREE